jgi:hypothetical protein
MKDVTEIGHMRGNGELGCFNDDGMIVQKGQTI